MIESNKVIIFVPGIRPKPPVKDHQDALWRCLLAGVEQLSPSTAESMAQVQRPFQVVPWSFEYYRMHVDITPDLSGIDAMLKKVEPSKADLAEAGSLNRRVKRWLYSMGDSMPIIGRLFASAPLRLRLSEIARYFDNADRVADRMRSMVKEALLEAWKENKKIMLIGHSFGSVIAYDALWELGHLEGIEDTLDTFVSMGSPMGLSYVRRDLKGAHYKGVKQFPINICRWRNIAAIGEVTAHHRALKEMQHTMAAAGCLSEATNHDEAVNFFRGPDGLNVHKCYGYFYNAKTAQIIVDWWNT